jgi:hypothetical protein
MKPYYAPTWETLAGKMFKTMEEAQAAEIQEMVSGEVRPVVKMYVKGRGLVPLAEVEAEEKAARDLNASPIQPEA